MKIGLNALRHFLVTSESNEQIIAALTKCGLEVDGVENRAKSLYPFIIAKVEECTKHEQSDKLNICKVNTGSEILQVICGASNVRTGLMVVFAPIGSVIPSSGLVIKKASIRGVESNGMICSAEELALQNFYKINSGQNCYKNTEAFYDPFFEIFAAAPNISQKPSWIDDGIIELSSDTNGINFALGESFFNYLKIDPIVVELSITPNRGDCTSIVGVARHLTKCGYGHLNIEAINNLIKSPANQAGSDINLTIDCTSCLSASFAKMDGVQITQSNAAIKGIMSDCGFEPKNNVVDATNFVMLTLGKPMHAYDVAKLDLSKPIKIKQLTAGENANFNPIVGEPLQIATECVVIQNDEKVISLAGIMGGLDSSIEGTTSSILLECAYFVPHFITQGIRRNALQSQSSYRFERGVDALTNELTINFFANLCSSGAVFYRPTSIEASFEKTIEKKIVEISLATINQKLGFDLDFTTAKNLLEQIFEKHEIVPNTPVVCKNDIFTITIPQYRHDISIAEDIVEELAICYGFDNIKPKPFLFGYGHFNRSQEAINFYENLQKARKIFSFMGFDEAINYSFIKDIWHGKFNFYQPPQDDATSGTVSNKIEIKNPIHADFSIMRDGLTAGLIKNISLNTSFGVKNVKFFEIGTCFHGFESQNTHIAFVISGLLKGKTAFSPQQELSIIDTKSAFVSLCTQFGLSQKSLNFEAVIDNLNLNPYSSYKVFVGKVLVGAVFEVHPICLEQHFELKNVPVFAGEIYYKNLQNFIKTSRGTYTEKNLQNVERSLSFIFDKSVKAGQILRTASKTSQIASVEITDIFEDSARLGADKKSISLDFEIEQTTQTLTKDQIDEKIMAEVIKNLTSLGGKLRDGSF